jgi:16S rRNA G966 N2-methylase RsmD
MKKKPAGSVTHIRDLVPDPKNRRKHNPRNIGMVVDSLQQVGAARSIVIDEKNVILAGNGVIEAAAEAGITKVLEVEADGQTIVAVRRRGLSEKQKRELAIGDNRSAELAEWNQEQLREDEAEGLTLEPWFSSEELAALKQPGPKTGRTDSDDVPKERATSIVAGDLFELGEHRILCGDSTRLEEAERVLGGSKADMVFTDPPYGVNVTGKGGAPIAGDISFTAIPLMFDVLDKVLAPKAWCYVCGGQSNMALYSRLFERYFRQLARVAIWDKGKVAVMRHNGYHSCYEMVYYAFKEGGGGQWFGARDSEHADDIWRISVEDGGDERVHVTQKPVAVPARAIGNSCPPKGLVFEPFSGSASTLIACETLDRRCAAMEISPSYVQVAIDRWEAFTGKKATKVGDAPRRRARQKN